MRDQCLETLLLLSLKDLELLIVALLICRLLVVALTKTLVRIVAIERPNYGDCFGLVRLADRLIILDGHVRCLLDMADLRIATEMTTGDVIHTRVSTLM